MCGAKEAARPRILLFYNGITKSGVEVGLGRMSKVRPIAAKLTSDPIGAYTRSVAAKESGAALTHPRGPIGHIDRDCNNKDGEQSTRRSSMGLK